MTSPKIYSESELQEAIAAALREERAKEAFHRLPLALQVFPMHEREPKEEIDYWDPIPAGERGGITLPAGRYFIGDVAVQLAEDVWVEEMKDGFYETYNEEKGRRVFGKFKALNDDYKTTGENRVWIDYEMIGIMQASLMEEPDAATINGYTVEIDREFRAGFDAATRRFWVEVPGKPAESFSVRLPEEYEDEDSE